MISVDAHDVESHSTNEILQVAPHKAYYDSDHQVTLTHNLLRLQQELVYTDLVLVAEGRELSCHRVVLAAACPYFHAILKDQVDLQVNVIDVKNISFAILGNVVEFAYTSAVAITPGNVKGLLMASNLLGLVGLEEACVEFMIENLQPSNCLKYHHLAIEQALANLEERTKSYILNHFIDIVKDRSFLDLDYQSVLKIIRDDGLRISSEDTVFECVLQWIRHDPTHRLQVAGTIAQYIRFPFCTSGYFYATVEVSEYMQSKACRDLIVEYKKYHAFPEKRHEFYGNERARPRKSYGLWNTIIVLGGYTRLDQQNNDIYVLDTRGQQWQKHGANLPEACMDVAIQKMMMCSMGDSLIVMITHCKKAPASHIWLYDVTLASWHDVTFNKKYRAHATLVLCGGKVFSLGGVKAVSSSELLAVQNHVEELSLHRKAWLLVSEMPRALYAHTAVTYQADILVFGGKMIQPEQNETLYSLETRRYSPLLDRWRQCSDLPLACASGSAVTVGDQIYAVAAYRRAGSEAEVTSVMLSYAPGVDEWTELTIPAPSQHLPTTLVLGHHLYLLGGCLTYPCTPTQRVTVLDTTTSMWSTVEEGGELPELPVPLCGHAVSHVRMPIEMPRTRRQHSQTGPPPDSLNANLKANTSDIPAVNRTESSSHGQSKNQTEDYRIETKSPEHNNCVQTDKDGTEEAKEENGRKETNVNRGKNAINKQDTNEESGN